MTKRLYYENAYCREFDARVTGCREGKRGWEVTLDQTAFYPEGGGQPADEGTLGEAKVLDVKAVSYTHLDVYKRQSSG